MMGWWIYENKLKSSLIEEKEGRIYLRLISSQKIKLLTNNSRESFQDNELIMYVES